jgi:hypothetical protein
MFGKAKNFFMKKLLEKQLRNAPVQQREMIMTLVEKDPALFEKITAEMQAEIKNGKSQTEASMKVMPKYQTQLRNLMGYKFPKMHAGSGPRFNPDGSIRK